MIIVFQWTSQVFDNLFRIFPRYNQEYGKKTMRKGLEMKKIQYFQFFQKILR